jgi:hypothetical protein
MSTDELVSELEELHYPIEGYGAEQVCDDDGQPWPCNTQRIIDRRGAL